MATLSLDKTVFLFPYCMWGCGEGVGWVKNPKTISDHFSIWNNFDFFIWPFFLVPNCDVWRGVGGWAGGSKNLKVISETKTNFRPIFSAFQPIWYNFDFFYPFFVPNMGRGGGVGQQIQKLFPTNFLAISANSGQLWFFSCWPNFFSGWGGQKIGNYFRPTFSPF